MDLVEVGKTISAATAAKLRAAIDALQELLGITEADAPEGDAMAEAATDPNVGGGVDRDKIPAADFAGKSRSFPIVTPGDVSDAASSIGRAGADNYSSDQLKANIIRIAKRKGASFVAELPKAWRDEQEEAATDAEQMPLAEEHIELIERAIGDDGLAHIRLISPGWGSSGYYPRDVLARDGPAVFRQGLHMHIDHQTEAERKAKQEGSLKDFAGVLASDARWEDDGPVGPGLYADAQVFEPYRGMLNEMAPHIGVSIRANGNAVRGEAEGRKGHIIEAITAANTTDYVTRAGAGGAILPLMESAEDPMVLSLFRGATKPTQEGNDVTEQEAEELRAENARLKEALLLREARDVVIEALAKVDMPTPTRARLTDLLAKAPPIVDGALDADAFQARITEAAKAELAYIAAVSGKGAIRGMGASAGTGDDGKGELKESFKAMYLHRGVAPDEAEKLAALAAGV